MNDLKADDNLYEIERDKLLKIQQSLDFLHSDITKLIDSNITAMNSMNKFPTEYMNDLKK